MSTARRFACWGVPVVLVVACASNVWAEESRPTAQVGQQIAESPLNAVTPEDSPMQQTLLAIDDVALPLRKNLGLYLSKPAVRRDPVLAPSPQGSGAPDDAAAHFYGTVLLDQGKFRMWYYACHWGKNPDWPPRQMQQVAKSPPYFRGECPLFQGPLCYAESDDGLTWTKPALGQVLFKGSRANNALAFPQTVVATALVIKDAQDPDPARRYKMTYEFFPDQSDPVIDEYGTTPSVALATSPDGLHWTEAGIPFRNQFVEPASFIRHDGTYIIHYQVMDAFAGYLAEGGTPCGRTGVARVSPDFVHWPDAIAEAFALAEPEDRSKRGMSGAYDQVHLGVGAASYGNVCVGLYCLWHNADFNKAFDQISGDLGLLISNDGVHFREPVKGYRFLRREDSPATPVPGHAFNTVLCQANGILNVGDETRIYHGRWRNVGGHDPEQLKQYSAEVALATLPRDRWGALGLNPKTTTGEVWSSAVVLPRGGCEIVLNADAARTMRVEIADENFEPFPEFSGPNRGTPDRDGGLDCIVKWPAGTLSALDGRKVRLRIQVETQGQDTPRLYAVYLRARQDRVEAQIASPEAPTVVENVVHAPIPDIGSRRQFWFNAQDLIAESTHLRILQQRPVKHPANPLLVADKPWEGTLVQLYSCDVHHDPTTGQWQMWYEGHPADVLLCTAFSMDGLRWTKPSLGVQEWKGSTDNNIILQTGYTDAHCASIVKAPNEKDPAKTYKLYYWVGPKWFDSHIQPMGLSSQEVAAARSKIKDYRQNGHYVAFSPDGIHFTPQTAAPVLKTSDFNTTLFDDQTGLYRSYHKIEYRKPGWSEDRRCMWLSESEDGSHFGESQLVLAPDEADDAWAKANGCKRVEYYGMHVWPQDGFYLGLLWVFTVTGGNDAYGRGWDDGKNLPHLIYSADGVQWRRMPVREPFIPPGPAGSFESGSIYSAGDHPVVIGDEIRFYYFGVGQTHGATDPINSPNHSSGFGLATLPRDRYVAWQGGAVAGTLLTKPFTFTGRELHLNIDASRGETRVALLDSDGKPLPGVGAEDCEAITTDGFDHVVTWRGVADLSAFAGKVIRVRFSLRQSALYTWQFREGR